jgi:hypothetical protein
MVSYDGKRRIKISRKRIINSYKQPFADHDEQQCPGTSREDFPDVIETRITQHTIVGLAEQERNEIDKEEKPNTFPVKDKV